MTKFFLTLLTAASLTALSAHAKTVQVPNEEFAIAAITLPDDWDLDEEVDNGIGATSDDGAVYLSVVAVGSTKGVNAEIDSTFAMLKEHGVTLDEKSKKEQKFKINGIDAEEMIFQGKDEDGAASISICFVPVKDKLLIMTYWVSSDQEAEHQAEVGKILNSLKPAA